MDERYSELGGGQVFDWTRVGHAITATYYAWRAEHPDTEIVPGLNYVAEDDDDGVRWVKLFAKTPEGAVIDIGEFPAHVALAN